MEALKVECCLLYPLPSPSYKLCLVQDAIVTGVALLNSAGVGLLHGPVLTLVSEVAAELAHGEVFIV